MSQWVRKSHFQRKTRHLYALVFDNERAVYVGQTVNMKQRGQQHAAPSGGWGGKNPSPSSRLSSVSRVTPVGLLPRRK